MIPSGTIKTFSETVHLRLLLLLSVGLFFGGMNSSAAQDASPLEDCEVLARVNNQVILACELSWEVEMLLDKRLSELPPEQRAQIPPKEIKYIKDKLTEQILMNRLDMALFYADFRSRTPDADLTKIHESLNPLFVGKEIPELMQRVGVEDARELELKLIKYGTSLQERRQDFYRKMIARSWLTETISYEKEITHEQMLDYYKEHRADYERPDRSRWEELMVYSSNYPSKSAAYAAMAELGNQVYQDAATKPAEEACFTQVAKTSSQGLTASKGGLHGWTKRGALASEEIESAIFNLEPGKMSSIIESPFGFHIVRVLEREEAGLVPFAKVQAKIKNKINDERFRAAMLVRVEELKSDARVWTKYKGDLSNETQVATKPEAKPKSRY